MRTRFTTLLVLSAGVALTAAVPYGNAAPPDARGAIWADCTQYGTFGTRATFRSTAGHFDRLFKNPSGFKDGVGAISDAAPGHGDFNGGRWQEMVLKTGVDGSRYANACSVDDLDVNDFEPSGNYFECPLLKAR